MGKDNLKQFIQKNRNDFDQKIPSLEAWEEISSSLRNKKLKSFDISTWLLRAVAVIVISAGSIGVYKLISENNTPAINQVIVSTEETVLPQEIIKANEAYSSRINNKRVLLASYERQYPKVTSAINTELQNLDDTFNELKKELKEGPISEEVIQAMIETYQIKVEILEEVLFELNENQKEQKHISWN